MTSTRAKTANRPTVAIIVPVMDRCDDLARSLPLLLSQDYADYVLAVIDLGSRDGLASVLLPYGGPRLRVLRCERPKYFNFARGRNIGVRYTSSDLLLFLNGDVILSGTHHLTRMVEAYLCSPEVDWAHWQRWRVHASLPPLFLPEAPALPTSGKRKVYGGYGGSTLLVDRTSFQALGGYNELFEDWGYEDTDMQARLELSGHGRIALEDISHHQQADSLRTANFRVKDKLWSWERNRRLSDRALRAFGVVPPLYGPPGYCARIEIDGTVYGSDASQQAWHNEVDPAAVRQWRSWVRQFRFLPRFLRPSR